MDELERSLRELSNAAEPPPPSPELAELVRSSAPAAPRRPGRQLSALCATSAAFAVVAIAILGPRPDLGGLHRGYAIALAAAWPLALCWLGRLSLVPRRQSVLLRCRSAGISALLIGAAFVALGLAWTESVAGVSIAYRATAANVLRWAPFCLAVSMGSALVPLALVALLLRRAVPTGAALIGAAAGACGGCLGGLVLHFHCHIAEPSHFGLVHGGAVLLASGLGATLLPRYLRS